MSKDRWLAERRADPWFNKAKREGYPSRSAYKLLFVQQRYKLIKEGDIIVDLGAAPGGMLKVESELAGPEGMVLAVDRRGVIYRSSNVRTLQIDILEDNIIEEIFEAIDWRRCDVVISDVSPNFSGVREVDALNQLELTARSLEIADTIVRRGGNILLKAFECDELVSIERVIHRGFNRYKRVITPPTLRRRSSEVYLLGLEKKYDKVLKGPLM